MSNSKDNKLNELENLPPARTPAKPAARRRLSCREIKRRKAAAAVCLDVIEDDLLLVSDARALFYVRGLGEYCLVTKNFQPDLSLLGRHDHCRIYFWRGKG